MITFFSRLVARAFGSQIYDYLEQSLNIQYQIFSSSLLALISGFIYSILYSLIYLLYLISILFPIIFSHLFSIR